MCVGWVFPFCLFYSWSESNSERRGEGSGLAFQPVRGALCCETDKTRLGNKQGHWVTASSQVPSGWLGYLVLEFIQWRCLLLGFHHRRVGRGELESGLFFLSEHNLLEAVMQCRSPGAAALFPFWHRSLCHGMFGVSLAVAWGTLVLICSVGSFQRCSCVL